jgi:hypothetical protein
MLIGNLNKVLIPASLRIVQAFYFTRIFLVKPDGSVATSSRFILKIFLNNAARHLCTD